MKQYPRFLPVHTSVDPRGSLTALEITKQTGVEVKRLFWMHDLKGLDRGGHAHIDTDQVIIMLRGSMTLQVEHLQKEYTFNLLQASDPVFLPRMTWTNMCNINKNSLILVASSTEYDISRSLRSYSDYKQFPSNQIT